jgi:hypothetical protein
MGKRAKPVYLVFISHSSTDTWVAKQLAREIRRCGATPFLDEAEINAGEDFEELIRAALEKANELVVLLTPWALDRRYVWAEIGAAWVRRVPIIALLHGMTPEELQSMPRVPVLLKKLDLLVLNQVGEYFDQLRQRVGERSRRKGAGHHG